MYETNLLMIGTVTSASQSRAFVSAKINPGPAEIVQKYLISGLCTAGLRSVEVVAAPRIPAWPKVPVRRVPEEIWTLGNARIHSVGFNNLEGLGFISRAKSIKKASLKWAEAHKTGHKTILIYSMHSPFLEAAAAIKAKDPETVVAMVVPDLPQYMSVHSGIKKILKEQDMKRIRKLMTCVDKYILYTKYMAEYFGLAKDRWIVVEGLMDVSKIQPKTKAMMRERPVCLYAGRLDPRYAVDKLIEAFGAVPDADLHLYGSPAYAEKLQYLVDRYPNVNYLGTLSQDSVFQRMREADLLLNPIPTDIVFAKYSCPSKTFEYIASGTSVLMTKWPGLPDEYDPYVYYFEDETAEGFAKKIIEVLSKSDEERREKGRQAQLFLMQNKDAGMQVQRIIDFIAGNDY